MSLTTLRLALRNLGRNRRRTLLAAGAVALGQLTLVFVNCMMAGMYEDMQRTITGPMVGHVQVRIPGWEEDRAIDLAVTDVAEVCRAIHGAPRVAAVSPRLYAPVLAAGEGRPGEPAVAEPAMLIGLDLAAEQAAGGILADLDGKYLPGETSLLIGRGLARRLHAVPGDTLALIGQDADEFPVSGLFTVRAILESPVEMVDQAGLVMPLDAVGRLLSLDDSAHEILVYAVRAEEAGLLAEEVKSLPPAAGLEVLSWREAVPELAGMLAMKGRFDLIFLTIVFLAAAAGVINTMMMSTFERRREFGMLLAIGVSPRRLVGTILAESALLGFTGVLAGSLAAVFLVLLTGRTGIDYAALTGQGGQDAVFTYRGLSISYVLYPILEWRHVFYGLGAVSLTAVLAGILPSLRTSRMEPMEALRG